MKSIFLNIKTCLMGEVIKPRYARLRSIQHLLFSFLFNRFTLSCRLIVLLCLFPQSAYAQPTTGDLAGDLSFDPAAVSAVMDSLFPDPAGPSDNIPGAVIVIVKDGQIVFSRGYGFRNLEKQLPVDPDSTLFYVGSVTKTFTATAVMQMVEQGKLDLHTDVNQYLTDFQVPATFEQPITLADLLTHTAGFDDRNIGYVALTEAEVRPLGTYLATDLPVRVMPPGMISSYSNHGYGLAGHLVELASGLSYADYIEKHILQPLEMTRSTAHLPIPSGLADQLAIGYDLNYLTRALDAQPLGYRNLPPAGSLSLTGHDMAKFMIAHLQDGRYEAVRILSEDSAHDMHSRQFTHHARLPGVAFGGFERFRGSVRSLEHAGGYIGFSSYMALVPEKQMGIFAVVNKTSGGASQIATRILDHYYPASDVILPPAPAPAPDLSQFTATYHWTRYGRHSIEKISIWDNPVYVTVDMENRLILKPAQGSPVTWQQIAPDLFQRIDRDEYLAFREEAGQITHLFFSQGGSIPIALERLAWYDDVVFNRPLLMLVMLVSLSVILLWPLCALIRKVVRHFRKIPSVPHPFRRAVLLAGLVEFLHLAFLIGIDLWLGNSQYRVQLIYGMSPEMIAVLWLPIISIPLTFGLVYYMVQIWKHGVWSRFGRVYYTLIAVTSLVFIAFVYHWQLLGFQY